MPRTYRACGLTVHANRAIPGLAKPPRSAIAAEPLLRVHVHTESFDTDIDGAELRRESPTDDTGRVLRVWTYPNGGWCFQYSDGATFLIDGAGTRIDAHWPAEISDDGAAVYLQGPVMGWALRLRGTVCLHACAVAVDDGCFAVVAPAGHSKSTTAAACARRGVAVLTDDLLPLAWRTDGAYVHPTYPRIRLWPDSVAGLFGSPDALPRITPDDDGWDKRFLDLQSPGYSFAPEALPLRAVYVGVRDESSTLPVIEPVAASEALVQLSANSYSRALLTGEMRAHELDMLGRLVQHVPVRRYRIRRGIEHLDALSELLCSPSTPRFA